MPRGRTRSAGRISRRRTLHTAAAGAALTTGPWIVKRAFATSGQLNILHWADEVQEPVLARFVEATGIRVNATGFSREADQLAKLRAADAAFDLCQPPLHRAPEFADSELLAPFDMDRLANAEHLLPSLWDAAAALWSWQGEPHYVPHCWGAEAIAWRTDLTTLDYASLSYGTLWDEAYRGKVQGRPHSLLLGIGLWLDAAGELSSNRMHDAYEDEAAMQAIYDRILETAIEKRPWIAQFWDTAASAAAGFMERGCTIGQTWDGPAVALKMDGQPVSFMAPQEGAIAWVDGWAMTAPATNRDEAYEFLNYLMTPEANALVAETSRYNPVVVGADAHMPEAARRSFLDAYPEDAFERLWFRPSEPAWFTKLRVQYAERFRAA